MEQLNIKIKHGALFNSGNERAWLYSKADHDYLVDLEIKHESLFVKLEVWQRKKCYIVSSLTRDTISLQECSCLNCKHLKTAPSTHREPEDFDWECSHPNRDNFPEVFKFFNPNCKDCLGTGTITTHEGKFDCHCWIGEDQPEAMANHCPGYSYYDWDEQERLQRLQTQAEGSEI